METEGKFKFYSDCVGWPSDKIDALHEVIDSGKQITRETFLKHVDRDGLRELETALGYEQNAMKGLTMAGDWHVDYRRSTMNGQRCYLFVHSAIEFVFTK
jgi:hypothetical protein